MSNTHAFNNSVSAATLTAMMSAALTLIVVGLTVVNLANTAPCILWPRLDDPIHRFRIPNRLDSTPDYEYLLPERETEYRYTPGIGSHKVHRQIATWNVARLTCEEEGGHLAIINSIAELDILRQLFNESGKHRRAEDINHVHIGFHDLYHDNEWVTVLGEPLTDADFNIWAPGEPNHSSNNTEHCGSMCRGGKLNDMDCHKKIGFICEIPETANQTSTVGPVLIDQRIQSETRRNDYNYTANIGAHKVHTQAVDWNSARKICIGEGGQLAVINSRAESELIARLLADSGNHLGSINSNYVHIGFHDLYSEGQFVTINGESIEKVGFNEWKDGEPNNGAGNGEDCGSMYKNGKLSHTSCVKPYGFVCELPYLPPSLVEPVPNTIESSNAIINSITYF